MCAINPKYSASIKFEIYTAHEGIFEFIKEIEKAIPILLECEQKLNSQTKLRWHLKDPEEVKLQISYGRTLTISATCGR